MAFKVCHCAFGGYDYVTSVDDQFFNCCFGTFLLARAVLNMCTKKKRTTLLDSLGHHDV